MLADRSDWPLTLTTVISQNREASLPQFLLAKRWTRSKPLLHECRADAWFQGHPEGVDRLESVLTKFYFAGEGPEWEALWNKVHAVLEGMNDTPVDRCQALAVVLQSVALKL
jgi:hypothetical protein